MCLFQMPWVTAGGRGFKEYESWIRDGEPSLILFSVLAGLSTPSPPFTLFSTWIPRFMEHTRLSVLAQKAELHCLLILVIHPFQI